MSIAVKSFLKATVEVKRLYLDYSCFLAESEQLQDLQTVISPFTTDGPLTLSSGFTDAGNKKLTVMVGGGIVNTNYTIQFIVRTTEGQVKRDNVAMRVIN